MTFYLEYVLNNLMIPGQVENWVTVMNFKGVSLMSFPTAVIFSLIGSFSVCEMKY